MTSVRNILIGFVVSAVLAGIIVSCGGGGGSDSAVPTYTVGGNITGATGTVVLKLNGGSDTPMAAAGAFTFPTGLVAGSTYNVQVAAPNQRCTVASGAGTMGAANISNVAITCGAQTTEIVIRSASLTGAQEVPPTGATGTGRGAVIVNPTTKEITGGITFAGLTGAPNGAHIHRADTTIVIGLVQAADNATATLPEGATPGTGPILSDADYAELLAGTLYFNVHTGNNPNGEIRGQITLQGGVTAGLAALDGAQEGSASTAVGLGTIVFDSATRDILTCYVTHNVVGTNVAHIHTGAPGVSGPANVVTLTKGTNVYTAPSPTTLTDVTNLNAGNTYFNVHSLPNFPSGEIRGQIAIQ